MTQTGREKIANNLKRIMQEKKMSQVELAVRMGVHTSTISNWINAKRDISFEKRYYLARCLGVDMKEFIKGVELEEM